MVGRGLVALLLATILIPLVAADSGVATPAAARQASLPPITVRQLESLFASEGIITVRSISSAEPVDPVVGAPTMRFTVEQVRAMAAASASGSGLRGSALDAVSPAAAGMLPFAYVLAAWASTGRSRGAAAVRSLMGAEDWSEAPNVVFPVLALPLFTADAIGAAQAMRSRPGSAISSQRLESERSTLGVIDSPCSLVSGFIDDVMSTVFDALTVTSPPGATLGASVGRFFVEVWNTGLGYAKTAVSGLLKIVTETVIKQIENMAAAASVIAEVVTNIGPWTATVTPLPSAISLGSGGAFKVHVSSAAGETDYPSAVSDCANRLGFTLPSLNAKRAPAKWTLSTPLEPSSPTSVLLDPAASSTISYTTKLSSPAGGSCSGPSPGSSGGSDFAVATVTVSRPAVEDIRGLLANLLSTNVPVVGSKVQKILKPLIDAILKRLDSLTEITGSAKVVIKAPSGGPPTCGSCLVGDWTVTKLTFDPGVTIYSGGAGTTVDIAGNGTVVSNFTPGGTLVSTDGNTLKFGGSETDHYALPANTKQLSGSFLASTISAGETITYGGAPPVAVAPGSTSGSYECVGGGLILSFPAGGHVLVYTMIPATHTAPATKP
jgi:hypothetical protein